MAAFLRSLVQHAALATRSTAAADISSGGHVSRRAACIALSSGQRSRFSIYGASHEGGPLHGHPLGYITPTPMGVGGTGYHATTILSVRKGGKVVRWGEAHAVHGLVWGEWLYQYRVSAWSQHRVECCPVGPSRARCKPRELTTCTTLPITYSILTTPK